MGLLHKGDEQEVKVVNPGSEVPHQAQEGEHLFLGDSRCEEPEVLNMMKRECDF